MDGSPSRFIEIRVPAPASLKATVLVHAAQELHCTAGRVKPVKPCEAHLETAQQACETGETGPITQEVK